MNGIFSRTERLIGSQALEKLHNTRVMVVGVGGVGSYVAEALCRAGIGSFVLVDSDKVDITNINRQLEATHDTVGKFKCDAMLERMKSINPDADIKTEIIRVGDGSEPDYTGVDYIADAIDCIPAKLLLIKRADELGIKIVSCMGTGNKLDPTQFRADDIFSTHTCPLCRAVRKGVKELGLKHLRVVWSPEPRPDILKTDPEKRTPASISFVPSSAGLIIAGEIVRDIINRPSCASE